MTDEDEWGAIGRLVDRLATRFPQLSGATIEEVVVSVHRQLLGAPIRSYVPVLVEHDARDRLTQLAQREPTHATDHERAHARQV